jgi:hypothetical protein
MTQTHIAHSSFEETGRISPSVINDARLSFQDRGLLIYMLSQPRKRTLERGWLAEATTDAADDLVQSLTTLIELGYAKKTEQVEPGEERRVTWEWFEEPGVEHQEPDPTAFTPTKVRDAWNNICISLPQIAEVTHSRFKAARARAATMDDLEKAFRMVESSDFITGRAFAVAGKNKWANFDWVMKPTNWTKIIEGKYSNEKNTKRDTARRSDAANQAGRYN